MAVDVRRACLVVVLTLFVATCAGGEVPDAATATTAGSTTSVAPTTAAASTTSPTLPPTTLPPTTLPPTTLQAVASDPPAPTAPVEAPTAPVAPPAVSATCPSGAGLLPQPSEPVRVIFDTDFSSDVDDAGALAVLHALADLGEVEILAVMVADGGEAPSHRAIDAINTYYARPDLPIGVVEGAAPVFSSAYVAELASQFPNDIEDPRAAVDLYREILASEPDNSVTIVSVGYLTNLDALLSSPPDENSASSGEQLVAAKVRRWAAMGGYYPNSIDHPFATEFNFAEDEVATLNSVGAWPTPAVFSGWEVGEAVLSGGALQTQTPPENPVREAYRLFNGGEAHRSWDLTAVLVAVRGTAGLFEVCAGRNIIGQRGSNVWQPDVDGPQGYLRLVVPASDVAAVLDALLVAPPAGT